MLLNQLYNSTYVDIGLLLVFLGLSGILFNRTNLILSIISIELMFYGINYYLLVISTTIQDLEGSVLSMYILTSAAGESAVALAILMVYFKKYRNIELI